MNISLTELNEAINEQGLDAQDMTSHLEYLEELLTDIRNEREEVSIENRYLYPGHSKAIDGLLNMLSLMKGKLQW